MRIDWSHPIEAVPTDGKKPRFAIIDAEHYRKPNCVPVKLHCNLWTGRADGTFVGGTWYFDDEGKAISGVDAKFYIRNKIAGDSQDAAAML